MVEWYMCLEWKFVYPSYIGISVFRCEFSDEVLLSVMGHGGETDLPAVPLPPVRVRCHP